MHFLIYLVGVFWAFVFLGVVWDREEGRGWDG